jgi:hypothetical protein
LSYVLALRQGLSGLSEPKVEMCGWWRVAKAQCSACLSEHFPPISTHIKFKNQKINKASMGKPSSRQNFYLTLKA